MLHINFHNSVKKKTEIICILHFYPYLCNINSKSFDYKQDKIVISKLIVKQM